MKYPNVEVQLSGEDGNAFIMVSRTRRALRKAGVPSGEIEQFTQEATSGDYEDVLLTIEKWVNVS